MSRQREAGINDSVFLLKKNWHWRKDADKFRNERINRAVEFGSVYIVQDNTVSDRNIVKFKALQGGGKKFSNEKEKPNKEEEWRRRASVQRNLETIVRRGDTSSVSGVCDSFSH